MLTAINNMRNNINKKTNKPIPVTVITGFLGSGKTTLVNRILTEEHGKRIAVIENEFGEIGIDQDLVINEKEELIEMNNGCICCTVRGDLIRIIKKLLASEKPPEHILIETTGLADPSPVAQTFITEPDIEARVVLDSIITIVDAKHLSLHIDSAPEAKDQIAFADIIIVNKTDLVTNSEKTNLIEQIQTINRFAVVHEAVNSGVSIQKLFNVGGFDIDRALSINPKFLEVEYPFEAGIIYDLEAGKYKIGMKRNGDEADMKLVMVPLTKLPSEEELIPIANHTAILFSGEPISIRDSEEIKVTPDVQKIYIEEGGSYFLLTIPEKGFYAVFTQHLPEEFLFELQSIDDSVITPVFSKEYRAQHSHDNTVNSVGIEIMGNLDAKAFLHYIHTTVRYFGNELYRYKGIISIEDEDEKIVLQGVHMLFEMKPAKQWGDKERKSTIVFIGKGLDRNILTQGFLACKKNKL